ncbi:MAG: hypothetical protein MJ148_00060 [Clostridia bacterium]|nr:hypothetical protein [Clostridia bacterium]
MANNKNTKAEKKNKKKKGAARFLAFALALIFIGSAATYLLLMLGQ